MKPGRTSYAEKTKSIDEVKKLEIQSRLRADGTLVSSEEHTLEMDKIIRNLTDTHLQHIPEPGRVLDAVDRREGEYLVSIPFLLLERQGCFIRACKQMYTNSF